MMLNTTPYRHEHLKLIRLCVVGLGLIASGCSNGTGTSASLASNNGSGTIPAANSQIVTSQATDLSASKLSTQSIASVSAAASVTSNGVYAYGSGTRFPSSTYEGS